MSAFLEALQSRGDFARYFAPDIVLTTMEDGAAITGREAARDFIVAFHTRMFDAHPELVNLAVSDGVAAAELVFAGSHTGEFAGLQPTGTAVRLPYTAFYDVTDDGITGLRLYLSVRGLVDQVQTQQTVSAAP
ncbi:ester cyclase [Microbacteriaceae bacterium 4G12]